MKKRILALVLAMVLAFAMCACGSSSKGGDKDQADKNKKAEEQAPAKYVLTKQVTTYEGGQKDGYVVTAEYSYDKNGIQIGMKESAVDKDGKEDTANYGQNDYTLKKEDGIYKRYMDGSDEAIAEYTFNKNGDREKIVKHGESGDETTAFEYDEKDQINKVVTTDKDDNETRVLTYGNTDEYVTNFICKSEYEGQVEREYKAKFDEESMTVTYIMVKGAQDYYPYQVVYIMKDPATVDSVETYDKDGNLLSKATSKWDDKIGHIVESTMENNAGVKTVQVNTWEPLK